MTRPPTTGRQHTAGQGSTAALLSGIARHIDSLATGWALVGGGLLCLVVAVNVLSVLGGALLDRPVPGDFELSEIGVALAVFCFLPYCQIRRANVSADLFTAGASPRWGARMALAGSLVALGVAALLVWRMTLGMLDQKAYGYTTMILQIPHWLVFPPILLSLLLLLLAAAVTLARDARAATAPDQSAPDQSECGGPPPDRPAAGR